MISEQLQAAEILHLDYLAAFIGQYLLIFGQCFIVRDHVP